MVIVIICNTSYVHTNTHTHMHFIQLLLDFNINFYLKFKGGVRVCQGGASAPPRPTLNEALHVCV